MTRLDRQRRCHDLAERPVRYCGFCECNVTTHPVDNGFGFEFGSQRGYHHIWDLACDVCGEETNEVAREEISHD